MVEPVPNKTTETVIIIESPKNKSDIINSAQSHFPEINEDKSTARNSLNQIEAIHIQEENKFEDIENNVEDIENLSELVEQSLEADIPSFSDIVDRWGNEEIALLYHQYIVIRKIEDSFWKSTSAIDVGVRIQSDYARLPMKIAAMYPSQYQLAAYNLERDLSAIVLAYKLPSKLGKIGILIYKLIFLLQIEKILNDGSTGMTEEQKSSFKDWLGAEKGRVSETAKISLIKFGASTPGYLSTFLRVCQINAPLLRLGLSWVCCVLDPIVECYDLYQAFKGLKEIKQDMNKFTDENFRRSDQLKVIYLNQTESDHSSKNENNNSEFIQSALQKDIHDKATDIRNKRMESLLAKRADFEDNFQSVLDAIQRPSSLEKIKDFASLSFGISENITSLEDLAEFFQNQSLSEIIEKAFLLESPEDIKLYLEGKGLIVGCEITSKADFKKNISTKFHDALDGALACLSKEEARFAAIKGFFEERGLTIDPNIKSAEEFFSCLQEEKVQDYLLARYIDVNSKQQMLDTTRNALKTLVMKKQQINKNEALWGLQKSSLIFAAVVLSSVLTITLLAVTATGVVAIPSIVFLIPAFGMLGLSTALLILGLVRFYKNSPNLFVEYVKGSFIKLAAYDIPRGIHDLRKSITILKIGLKSRARNRLAHQLTQNSTQKLQDKMKKLNEEDAALKAKLEHIQKKLNYWDEKIKPIAAGIALAKWKDFLQERPKRVKDEGDVGEIIEAMKAAFLEGSIDFDEDVKKILQERFGIDINDLKDPKVAAALWAFAP